MNYAIGSLPTDKRKRLRGVVFDVSNKVEALRMHRELSRMARAAIAEATVADFLAALHQKAASTPNHAPLFKAFAEDWLKTCVEGSSLSESEREASRGIVRNHLIPAFGQLLVAELGPRHVDLFKAAKRKERHQFKRTYSGKSINNMISVLRRILVKAQEYGHIDRLPVSSRTWAKRESSEESRPWWTPDEEARAFATLDGWKEQKPGWRIAILTQLVTGIRFSELRALRKEDLDLQTPGIHIRRSMARQTIGPTKNKKPRFQVIPRALAEELREWMLRISGQLLFTGPKGGPISNNSLNRKYRELSREAAVPEISSHGARHTAGSSYAFLGAGNKGIAVLLGHANMASTERYTHLRADGLAHLVEARWERLTGPKSG